MGYWDSFVDMHIVHSFFFSQASCTGRNWATRWPEARERGVKANSLIHHDIGWPVRMHPERFGWWQPGALNVCFEKLIMPESIHWFSNIFYQIFDSRRTWRYLTLDQTIDIHSQYVNWHETFLVHGVVSMVSFLTSQKQFGFACHVMPVKFTPLIILDIPWCFAWSIWIEDLMSNTNAENTKLQTQEVASKTRTMTGWQKTYKKWMPGYRETSLNWFYLWEGLSPSDRTTKFTFTWGTPKLPIYDIRSETASSLLKQAMSTTREVELEARERKW